MIPILYDPYETFFRTYGICALSDATECIVREERNGLFELSLSYLADGDYYQYIKPDFLIYATPREGDAREPFRIYSVTQNLNGSIQVKARHVSYDLAKIPCMPFTAANCADALAGLKANAIGDCSFVFSTNKATVAPFKCKTPEAIFPQLGGQEGSILDVYGGEYLFSHWNVQLLSARGEDRGVRIEYGKNMTALDVENDATNRYYGVVPFWAGNDGAQVVTLPEQAIYYPEAEDAYYTQLKVVDFSDQWEEAPTEAQLRARTQTYMSANTGWNIRESIEIDFVALWQTEQYKHLYEAERVALCDTVQLYHKKLGLTAEAKVVAAEYDVLNERYRSITVGNARRTLPKTIAELVRKTGGTT